MLTLNVTEYKTREGKTVYSLNKTYHNEIIMTVIDLAGRNWTLLKTVFEGKTTEKWVCEDKDARFTLSGGFTADEIKNLDGNFKVGKPLEIKQSAQQELVLD